MKLFQRLLVAPAALGLMAPVAANADTAFTSSTTLSGSAFFTVGSVEAGKGDADEEMHMQYAYHLDVNSSFTGEDLLTAGIVTGNTDKGIDGDALNPPGPLSFMDSAEGGANALSVGSLYYSFPVGDLSITAGPLLDQDDVVAATTSAYSDAFRLGSMPYSLAGNETGPGIGASYSNNGFVASASFVADNGDNAAQGINTDTGNDVTTFTLGYNGDSIGGGIVMASNDGDIKAANGNVLGYDTFGAGIYYSPESFDATFSVAYDTKDPSEGGGDDAADLFIGVDYEVGPGTLSAAWNQTEVDGGSDNLDVSGFEVSYTYAVNDGITLTPGFFSVEDGEGEEDQGMVLEAAFSF